MLYLQSRTSASQIFINKLGQQHSLWHQLGTELNEDVDMLNDR